MINMRYHPTGAMYGPLGDLTVQDVPAHEKLGNRMRAPMELPCVLDSEPSRETLMFPLVEDVMVKE
jgi:hypothetical protein